MDSIFQIFYEGVIPIIILSMINMGLFFVKDRRVIIQVNIAINVILVFMLAWIIYINRIHVYSDLVIYHMPFLREEALRLVYNLSNQFIALLFYGVVNLVLLYTKLVFKKGIKPAV